jgi:hypothetical protein
MPRKEKKHSFFREAWILAVERAQTRKALRLLSKQEWSVDFLTAMLLRAANLAHRPLQMTITHKDTSITIRTTDELSTSYKPDNIFDHLDDDLRIRQFIAEVNR